MLSWLQHRWTALWLLILALSSLSLFLYGFFPLKYHSGKLAHIGDLPNYIDGISVDGQTIYDPGENTVVLMVIDGLRYDFVREDLMPFTGEIVKNKTACIYVCVADPPTVTMPRIKAMMTGSVSTFADVALNFGAPAVQGDSVLRVAANRGRKSIMYGDDTWLRLFPGLWSESDGTTSFFVTDYTEVDNNVTRHLDKVLTPDEKNKPTFDFLVLHYLGLDHIGHLEGANSPKIKPKLLEMDEIVKKIYTAMQKWDRTGVLMIGGDHGMRDAGGHGGSSPAEVLVPLVVVKTGDNACPYKLGPGPAISQVDIAPTIAWLLNAPIPGDSSGTILPSLMPADIRQQLYLLHLVTAQNAKQLGDYDAEYYKTYLRADKQFGHFLLTGQRSAANIAKEFYQAALHEMAPRLTGTATDFDLFALLAAILLLYVITAALICVTLYSLQPEASRKTSVPLGRHKVTKLSKLIAFVVMFSIIGLALGLSCVISETKSQYCSFNALWSLALLATCTALTVCYFIIKTAIEKIKDMSPLRELNAIDYLLIIGTLLHAFSFFGTSFIEEEHMTWYYFWNTLMFFILMRTLVVVVMYVSKKLTNATEVQEKPHLQQRMNTVGLDLVPKWVLLIALHRYLRTMNQTGDRWLFLPDTADWLNAPENSYYLQLHLVIGTLATFAICLWNVGYMNNIMLIHTGFTTVATLCIFCYRCSSGALPAAFLDVESWDPVHIVNIFWGVLFAQFVFEILTYTGIFKKCGLRPYSRTESINNFEYTKPKAKHEDIFYDKMEEPWNLDAVKLNLARSMSHIMLNDLLLIITLLMRPHNVIMVPSIYFTSVLTIKCLDHKLLDPRPSRQTEVADSIGQTLAHIWIGSLFFFYQGNSNSLASVDLGSGYVGLREYSAALVAARMGLHAYAGPALAGAALFCHLAAAHARWHG
ncbi:GPI ethanolamine phosphate transferase 2 isoform X1 [Epargyreus clarus]|uniref:GPI ethanolamine phosphate transferase 2 isoform X1 n=1 Tax=Epargyreus clarus TaxID=520877 RepID=UPI003C2E65ED